MSFSSIAILSPGLLGGSIAMAVRERMPAVQIKVWARRAESVDKVRELGLADVASTDPAEIARGAALIIFCMPIGCMPEVAEKIAPVVSKDALVTDVGSVKAPVVSSLAPIFRNRALFVGSHPMAGSEQTGLDAARADLFDGAVTIVTPDADTPPGAVEAVSSFWKTIGCRVAVASPRVHDDAIGLVSHLPHLVAAALVRAAFDENPVALDWRGSGFMDTTRVASGPPAMWAEILLENRDAVKKAINAMVENLTEASKLLDAGDAAGVENYLAQARDTRNRLKQKTIS